MGAPTGAGAVTARHDYKTVSNNTNKKWWLDPGRQSRPKTLPYDGSLFNGIQTIDAWQEFFNHPSGNLLGLMNSAALFPGLVTPFFAEAISRVWGRRWAVWVGILINVGGVIVNSAATNLGMYIAGRAIMGIGISMGLTAAPVLLQEIAHPRYRAQIGSMYTTIYFFAAIISASVCLGTRNMKGNISWRLPCYLQLVGPVITFIMTCRMPESPRWLAKNGRQQEAFQFLIKYHANGDEDDALAKLEYSEIIEALEYEDVAEQSKYTDYLKPANRHRLFILISVAIGSNFVGNGVVSYYLSPILNSLGITSTLDQALINLGMQIWNLILSSGAALSVDKVGRRPLWLTSNIGMLFSMVVVMGLSGSYATHQSSAVGTAVIPFLFIFYGFYDISWTPLGNMYTVEILPYNLRAKGVALYNAVQGSANAVNQWVNPILLDAIHWKLYAVYIAILAAYVIMIWFGFPETKGLTIEAISDVFDKKVDEEANPGKVPKMDQDGTCDHVEDGN